MKAVDWTVDIYLQSPMLECVAMKTTRGKKNIATNSQQNPVKILLGKFHFPHIFDFPRILCWMAKFSGKVREKGV